MTRVQKNPLPNRVCTNSTEPSSCTDPSAFPPPCQEDVGKMGNVGWFGSALVQAPTTHPPSAAQPGNESTPRHSLFDEN